MTDTLDLKAIVLSSMPIGETDRRLLLLTAEYGKISCFARGSRRQNSAFSAPSRPFSFGTYSLYPGKNSYSLNRAEVDDYFEELVTDPLKSAYGCYFLELSSAFTAENVRAKSELELLYYGLSALRKERMEARFCAAAFEFKSLHLAGLLPEFTAETNPELDKSTVYALSFIARTEPSKLFTFQVTEKVYEELRTLSEKLLTKNLPYPLNSKELLRILTS